MVRQVEPLTRQRWDFPGLVAPDHPGRLRFKVGDKKDSKMKFWQDDLALFILLITLAWAVSGAVK